MRFRIGYGGPSEYRHGRRYPGGRVNNGGMTEFERLIHLIASMQILFGSRRGGWVVPLVLIGLVAGGWFMYRSYYSPEIALERAHALYESSDTKEQIKAIKEYKVLLQKSSPMEPNRFWLLTDRDVLYRRIIQHELKFTLDEDKAYEWVTKAYDEGLTNLRFKDKEVKDFWRESTAGYKRNKRRPANRRSEAPQTNPQNSGGEKFGVIPGLDG